MKKHFLFLGLITLTCFKLFSQNHVVINPPYYLDNTGGFPVLKPLPIPSTMFLGGENCDPDNYIANDPARLADGYDGRVANGSSNMIADTNGNIVFFVIDGVIFNKRGKGVATLPGFNDYEYDYLYDNYNSVHGSNEITIIQDKTNCDRYYIFSVDLNDNGTTFSNEPRIVLYDSALEIIVDNYPLNSLTASGQGLFITNGGVLSSMGYVRYAQPSVAATKTQSDGNQYIIFSLNKYFEVAKLNSNGLSPQGIFEKINTSNGANINRPILEVYDLANGNHIVATQYCDATVNNYISLFTFNSDFTQMLSEVNVPLPDNGSVAQAFVHGLEFSPNGQFLYFTHITTNLLQGQLKYIDLSNPTVFNNVPVPLNFNFQFSEIENLKQEIAEDVYEFSLILAHQNGIVKMSNPNTPQNITFSTLSSFANTFNYSTFKPEFQTNQTKYYQLPDQIDDFNYEENKAVYFDAITFKACENQTWQPNILGDTDNNPFTTSLTDIIYIKEELRIPAGKNITIKDMIFKFAPGAKVVVERSTNTGFGTAGILTLDNTTFTVDDRCEEDMWLGVEVYGYNHINQSTSSPKQGVLIMRNNSIIEHAHMGVFAGKRANPTQGISTSSSGFGGGIVSGNNSTFSNNVIGVRFAPYTYTTSVSNFYGCKFIWEDVLKNESFSYLYQVMMESIKGVKFRGNRFANNNSQFSNLINKGRGIFANNAEFTVKKWCITSNCSIEIESTFTNLDFGIYVYNPGAFTFEVDNSSFIGNLRGIYALNAKNELITRNKFEIIDKPFFTLGVFLSNSTGYTVEENDFKNLDNIQVPFSNSRTYGIVVNNSGTLPNLIYKNDFSRLMIGGQSQRINGVLIVDPTDNNTTGLQWKCNRFFETKEHDLKVINGRIDWHQGTNTTSVPEPILYTARNQFSLSSLVEPSQHDIVLHNSQDINYVHLDDANHFPNSRTISVGQSNGGIVIAQQALDHTGRGYYMTPDGCPSSLPPFSGIAPIGNDGKVEVLKGLIAEYKLKLSLGSSEELGNQINNSNNLGSIISTLVSRSPYLSDDILEKFMDKEPSTGQLKQILMLNSALNKKIKDKLELVSMPQGSRKQINDKQVGINPRKILEGQILELEKQIVHYDNMKKSRNLLDTIDLSYHYAKEILTNRNNLESDLELFDIYSIEKDITNQNLVKERLLNRNPSSELESLLNLEIEISAYEDLREAINVNPGIETALLNIKNSSASERIIKRIEAQLGYINPTEFNDTIFYLPVNKSLFGPDNQAPIIEEGNVSYVTIYPNPSQGKVNFDFQNVPDGKMTIEIFDLSGKSVYINNYENTNGEIVDLSDLKKGMYLVKVLIDNQIVEVQKLNMK